MSTSEELTKRKIVQRALAYVAEAWVAVQLASILAPQFGWPAGLERGITVLMTFGLPAVLVLVWSQREKGRQRVSGPELLMLAALLVIAGAAVAFVRGDGEPAAADAERPDTILGPDSIPERSIAVLPLLPTGSEAEPRGDEESHPGSERSAGHRQHRTQGIARPVVDPRDLISGDSLPTCPRFRWRRGLADDAVGTDPGLEQHDFGAVRPMDQNAGIRLCRIGGSDRRLIDTGPLVAGRERQDEHEYEQEGERPPRRKYRSPAFGGGRLVLVGVPRGPGHGIRRFGDG